jgi:hypothetical protein
LLILLGDLTFTCICIVSISNKMQRYTVYLYLETALHVSGWYFHPSSGAHTIVSTASGICHIVTAICRYRGRVGTGLSVLWVAYSLLFHCNNVCKNAPHCYVLRSLPVLFSLYRYIDLVLLGEYGFLYVNPKENYPRRCSARTSQEIVLAVPANFNWTLGFQRLSHSITESSN